MIRRFLAFIFFVSGYCVYGQTLENKHHRVLILLDASLSMNEPTDGYATKYAAASDFIIRLMDSIYRRNGEVEFGLRVYGHQYLASARQCFDTKLEVQFSRDNIEQMKMRLADVKPRGISNTYATLKEALEYDIRSTNNYVYHILIITDGGEACNDKDICSLSDLLKYKQVASPCIVLLDDKKKLNCFTESTKQLKKEDVNLVYNYLIHHCFIIPEHHTIQAPVKNNITFSTETKPIQKTTNINPTSQPSGQQTIETNAIATNNLKPIIPISSTEIKKGNGYLKIKGISGNQIIEVYENENFQYKLYKIIEHSPKNINQLIALPEGKYKLVDENNKTTELRIVKNMITQINL